jgi:hypothetical protein
MFFAVHGLSRSPVRLGVGVLLVADQFVWVSGLPLGPFTTFYLVLHFSADKYLILLSKASSLTRKYVCSLQCNYPLVPITILYRLIWDCVPFMSPLTTRRDYGGGILTRLHTVIPLDWRLKDITAPKLFHALFRRWRLRVLPIRCMCLNANKSSPFYFLILHPVAHYTTIQ